MESFIFTKIYNIIKTLNYEWNVDFFFNKQRNHKEYGLFHHHEMINILRPYPVTKAYHGILLLQLLAVRQATKLKTKYTNILEKIYFSIQKTLFILL